MTSAAAIDTFSITLSGIEFLAGDFARPECILATKAGDMFISDKRGGITKFRRDGKQKSILAKNIPAGFNFVPNGFALLKDRSFLIANVHPDGGVWHLTQNGVLSPYLTSIHGMQLRGINSLSLDYRGRVWISVSMLPPTGGSGWLAAKALIKGVATGFIILVDDKGPRVVAENLGFNNECKVDPSGKWFYCCETIAQRLSRFPIKANATLGPHEIVAEFSGAQFPDGLNFDAAGCVWMTLTIENALVRVAPATGAKHTVLQHFDPQHAEKIAEKFHAGEFCGFDPDPKLGILTSLAFGGDNLQQVYFTALGSSNPMDPAAPAKIGTFHSPVPGAEPPHWRF